jgi:hypothetical protein
LDSAGYLLREAAARRLDVQSRELRLGLWAQPLDANSARGWLFLADALENGAGYCTFLGQEEELRALLEAGKTFIRDDLEGEEHAAKCDASCYDCLREYGNQAYHGLLDWRLARDWLDLALGRPIDLARWASYERAAMESFCTAFSAEPLELEGSVFGIRSVHLGRLILVGHPLEHRHRDFLSERLALAWADAEDQDLTPEAGTLEVVSSFDLLRRPGRVAIGQ